MTSKIVEIVESLFKKESQKSAMKTRPSGAKNPNFTQKSHLFE